MSFQFIKLRYWKGQRLLLLAFLLLHTIASFYYISQQNITYDEPQYIEYAKRWLHGKPERIEPLDDSKSPIVAVCWIPRIVRQLVNPNYELHDYGRKDQKEGRYLMIIFSFVAAIYVYRWCKDLYGQQDWQLPLLLLLFDPLYLSYTTLITTDLACGAWLLALLYHFRKYMLYASRKDFYYAAVYTGIAIVTKQSLIFVLLLLPLLSSLKYILSGRLTNYINRRTIADVFLFAAIILIIINAFYYAKDTCLPLGQLTFQSHTFKSLQQNLSLLHWVPVPLPTAYIQSLDLLKAHAELGAGHPNSTFNGTYLFGTLKLRGGYWYYYMILLFYKLPIGIMLLLAGSVIIFFKKFNVKSFALKYQFIVVPVVFYWVILSFFNEFQSGIRHLLVVFPLLFIGMGYLMKQLQTAALTWKLMTASAIAYTFVTTAVYYPHLIPYTNEFIGKKTMIYKKVFDSSVDYGQADSALQSFVKMHPEYQYQTATPRIGKHAVRMGDMMNTSLLNTSKYKWYMAFEPVGHHRYTILLFNITQQDLEKADYSKTDLKIVP